MSRMVTILGLSFAWLALFAGSCGESPPDFDFETSETDTTGFISDSDADSDMDTDVDTAGDTDADADTGLDSEFISDTASEIDSDFATETQTENDTATEIDTGTGEEPPSPCADGVSQQQIFLDGAMVGCAGKATWANAEKLCGKMRYLCTAKQWANLRQGVAPKFNYWTADELRWGGREEECWVDEKAGGKCPVGMPMRVCAGHTDDNNNKCNWIDCGYGKNSRKNDYFGGCEIGTTAGALCCR